MDHRTAEELEAGLDLIRRSPRDEGRIELIVSRPAEGERHVLDEATLDPAHGVVGDMWHVRPSRMTPDGSPHPEMQLNVMNARFAAFIAGDPDRMALAGDQLYVDLDLSQENLPPGTQLALGAAVIEITEPPHLGCQKFTSRFGLAAHRFVNSPEGRELRLRGVNAKVVVAGEVRRGDVVKKVASRP